jgi:mono/diheme cytochrome c family protein
MRPLQLSAILLALSALAAPALQHPHTLPIARTRHAPDDLEVTGMIAGLPPGASGFVSHAALAALPQITTPVHNDPDFAGLQLRVTGIPLSELAKALGAEPASDLIDALCSDRYRSHYPADYLAAHQPIFVLKIDGESPAQWAARTKQYDSGPYFITHANYQPRYKVLSHSEQPQIPDNIVRLNFSTQAATFGPLTPRGGYPPDSPVAEGFIIAKQNCLRCHSLGAVGGTKSGRDWRTLGTWAREQPVYFARYVRNPASVEPHAHMPGNPTYDDATLAALTAYFRTFAEDSK